MIVAHGDVHCALYERDEGVPVVSRRLQMVMILEIARMKYRVDRRCRNTLCSCHLHRFLHQLVISKRQVEDTAIHGRGNDHCSSVWATAMPGESVHTARNPRRDFRPAPASGVNAAALHGIVGPVICGIEDDSSLPYELIAQPDSQHIYHQLALAVNDRLVAQLLDLPGDVGERPAPEGGVVYAVVRRVGESTRQVGGKISPRPILLATC